MAGLHPRLDRAPAEPPDFLPCETVFVRGDSNQDQMADVAVQLDRSPWSQGPAREARIVDPVPIVSEGVVPYGDDFSLGNRNTTEYRVDVTPHDFVGRSYLEEIAVRTIANDGVAIG